MTTDWFAQTQESVDRWLEAQRAWWTAVLGADQRAAGHEADAGAETAVEAARQAVEAWREAAYKVVDAQAEMLLGPLSGHEEDDAQALLRRWTDAQRDMWQDWLAVASGAAGREGQAGSPDWQQAGRQLSESLHQAAEHLVRSQAEWAKAWTGAQEDAGLQDSTQQDSTQQDSTQQDSTQQDRTQQDGTQGGP